MVPELGPEHNLCRLGIMENVATIRRPVGADAYTCTTTPSSFPWNWNTLWQGQYERGGELGAITQLNYTFFGRPRGLPPPNQQNHHLDPPRLPNSLRVPVRRGDVTPILFPEVSQLNLIP